MQPYCFATGLFISGNLLAPYDAVYIELATSLGAPLITAERSTTPWVVKLGNSVRPLDAANS
jgi:hypothetical protein